MYTLPVYPRRRKEISPKRIIPISALAFTNDFFKNSVAPIKPAEIITIQINTVDEDVAYGRW